MSKQQGGLGEENPFSSRRHAASNSVVPTSPNQGKQDASEIASNSATEPASELPPPPPGKEPPARVQMNTRILGDRERLLRKYQRQHGVTRQAVVDQMVDEYLQRRGLL